MLDKSFSIPGSIIVIVLVIKPCFAKLLLLVTYSTYASFLYHTVGNLYNKIHYKPCYIAKISPGYFTLLPTITLLQ